MREIKILNDESIFEHKLSSGLQVVIHPTKQFKRTLATLQVSFGGLDLHYEILGKQQHLPAGVAHFLEHMLFTNNGRNLAEKFSNHGANVNAFTTKSMTNYKFSCIEDFDLLLDYFLESFMTPEFDELSTIKEQRIIIHELNMSMDSLHHDIYQKLKSLIYHDDAITSDVGGTKKDVLSINETILKRAFNTFYHPKNMSLIITGNVDPIKLFEYLENHSYNKFDWPKFHPITRIRDDHSRRIHHIKKQVPSNDQNLISIGIKVPEYIFEEFDRDFIQISFGSIISNAFGLASKNFDILKRQKLMNVSFSTNSNIERDYGYINIYMQTNKQEKFYKLIMSMITDISKKPLDEELFDIDRKMILGNFITMFDSVSKIHDFVSSAIIENIDLNTYLDKILNLKMKDLEPIKAVFNKKNIFSVRYLKSSK